MRPTRPSPERSRAAVPDGTRRARCRCRCRCCIPLPAESCGALLPHPRKRIAQISAERIADHRQRLRRGCHHRAQPARTPWPPRTCPHTRPLPDRSACRPALNDRSATAHRPRRTAGRASRAGNRRRYRTSMPLNFDGGDRFSVGNVAEHVAEWRRAETEPVVGRQRAFETHRLLRLGQESEPSLGCTHKSAQDIIHQT